jgi:hypothetical protein
MSLTRAYQTADGSSIRPRRSGRSDDLPLQATAKPVLLDLQIVAHLKIDGSGQREERVLMS